VIFCAFFVNNSLLFVEEGCTYWAESSVTAQSKNYSQVRKDNWKEHYTLPKPVKWTLKKIKSTLWT